MYVCMSVCVCVCRTALDLQGLVRQAVQSMAIATISEN